MSKVNKIDFLAALGFLAAWRKEMGYFPERGDDPTWEEEAVLLLRNYTLAIAPNFKMDGEAMGDYITVKDEHKTNKQS